MQKKSYSTRAIAEAGMTIATFMVLMLLGVYTQLIYYVGIFILPIPIVILYLRHNLRTALACSLVSIIMVSFLFNPIAAIMQSLFFTAIGLILGYCIKRKVRAGKTIALLAVAIVIGMTVDLLISIFLVSGKDFMDSVKQVSSMMINTIDQVKKMYESQGIKLNTEQLNALKQFKDISTVDALLHVIPEAYIALGFIEAYICYVFTTAVLSRMRYEVKNKLSFSKIVVPDLAVAASIIFLCIGAILTKKNVDAGVYIFNAGVFLVEFLLLIDGISVAIYYLRNKYKIPKYAVVLLLIFFMVIQFQIVFMVVGIVDIFVDFRKLNPNRLVKF